MKLVILVLVLLYSLMFVESKRETHIYPDAHGKCPLGYRRSTDLKRTFCIPKDGRLGKKWLDNPY